MNIKETKKPARRITPRYLATLGIKAWDEDNLYPQNVCKILAASSTGISCWGRYADFIEGNGLTSQTLSDFKVNRSGQTFDDIHHLCSESIARFNGFALHVNYNLAGRVVELWHVPFENCRLEEPDEDDIVSNIIVHPDWTGESTRDGKKLKVTAETIEKYPRFNPDPGVIQAQIVKAGGIEHYNGQILWVSTAGPDTYPTPRFDCVLTEMSTDEGLSNVKNRNVRNNFLPAGMVVIRKAQLGPQDDTIGPDKNDGFADDLGRLQGDENSNKIIVAEIEVEEEKPEFISFKGENYDKEFTETDTSVVERIYSAFGQEAFYCVRSGKIGFSGTIIADAKLEYAQSVTKIQRVLTRAYQKVINVWEQTMMSPISRETITIEPIIKAVNNPE